jgi:branched-subunit amino acid aminotransferase/4-amino-4-deoxychorismate lyase
MALFESLPVLNGIPVLLEEHLKRLLSACQQSGFHLDLKALEKVGETFRSLRFDAFARIHVTAGDGPPTSAATQCRIFLCAEPRPPVSSEELARGYRVAFHPLPYLPVFAGLKTANYWANIHARQLAMERQNQEALLFNPQGELVSACMANVFVVREGRVRTPSPNTGARAGVLRQWVLERCLATEGSLSLEEVRSAEEIFLTSSGVGIMPVTALEGRPLSGRKIAAPLIREYQAFLRKL